MLSPESDAKASDPNTTARVRASASTAWRCHLDVRAHEVRARGLSLFSREVDTAPVRAVDGLDSSLGTVKQRT